MQQRAKGKLLCMPSIRVMSLAIDIGWCCVTIWGLARLFYSIGVLPYKHVFTAGLASQGCIVLSGATA